MENILIVACNQKKANEGLAFAQKHGYPKAVAVHQGAKSFTRKFQAVVIYHKKSTEVNLMKDLVRNYADVPIKISIGEEVYATAAQINVKPFVYEQAADALAFMNTEWGKLNEVMSQIFKQFDKDNSGFIDVHELKAMSKELSGKSMSNAEIEEIMHDFNRTKDNKITEKQFKQWWASGKQGLSPMMRNLIGAKLSTIQFFDSISENLKKSLDESVANAGAAQEDLNQNSLQINFNKFEQAGLTLTAKLLFFSPNLDEEYSRIKMKHGFGEVADLQTKGLVALSFPVKDISADEAVEKLKTMVDGLGLPEAIRSQISIINDLDKVAFGFVPPKAFLKDIDTFAPILDQVRQQAKVNQEIDITLRLASSPKLILEGEEPILNEILKGLQVHLKVNAWKRLSNIITTMLSEGALPENLMPILGGISPAFMLKVNGKLEIDIDDEMKEGLMTNPLLEPFMMPGAILVQSASKVHSDEEEEFKEHFEQSVPPPLQEIATFMMNHIGDEANLFAGQDLVGLQGRVTAEGMGLLIKTVLKFMG